MSVRSAFRPCKRELGYGPALCTATRPVFDDGASFATKMQVDGPEALPAQFAAPRAEITPAMHPNLDLESDDD